MKRSALIFGVLLVTLQSAAVVLSQDSKKEGEGEWKAPEKAAKKKNPIPADEKSIASGRAIFEQHCVACHGERGQGDGKMAKGLEKRPANLSNPKMWEQSDGALFWKISTGRKPMPRHEKRLSEDERWQVVNYIRTLATKKKDESEKKKDEPQGNSKASDRWAGNVLTDRTVRT